jgi:hypothetical protein
MARVSTASPAIVAWSVVQEKPEMEHQEIRVCVAFLFILLGAQAKGNYISCVFFLTAELDQARSVTGPDCKLFDDFGR